MSKRNNVVKSKANKSRRKEFEAFQKDSMKIYRELEAYNNNKAIGLDTDRLIAFTSYGKAKWKINERGHVNPIRKILKDAQKEFQEEMKELEKQRAPAEEREPVYEKATKIILETGLVDFDYDKECNNHLAGPVALGLVAREVYDFLAVKGGKDAFKHSQMLSRWDTLRHSTSLMELSNDTESSDITLQE